MKHWRRWLTAGLCLAAATLLFGQTGGLSIVGGLIDFSAAPHTLPAQVGLIAGLPVTCTVGEQYFATDAAAGANLYGCTATNTWTQLGGAGSPVTSVQGLTGAVTVTDANLSTSNVTTNDCSTSKHGFAPKAPNDATQFLNGLCGYSVPAGGGGSTIVPSIVQMNAARASTLAYPFNVTASNPLVVMFGWEGGANTPSTLSDTVATSWAKAVETTGAAVSNCAVFIGAAGGSGANTATPGFPAGAGFSGIAVFETTNLSTTSDGTFTGALALTNALTSSFDGDLVVTMNQGDRSAGGVVNTWAQWLGIGTNGNDSGAFMFYVQPKAGKLQTYIPNASNIIQTCSAAFKHS